MWKKFIGEIETANPDVKKMQQRWIKFKFKVVFLLFFFDGANNSYGN